MNCEEVRADPRCDRCSNHLVMKGVVVFLIVLAGIIGAFTSKGHSSKQTASTNTTDTGSVTASDASVSSCSPHGKTVLSNIPADASQFRFDFIGGGFSGHSWHTDWLPNDNTVKNGSFWIYTIGDNGTDPTGVTAEVQMSDGSTVTTDMQECY